MENDNNEYYRDRSGDNKSNAGTLESVDDTILMDDNSAADDTEEGSSKDAAILRANKDDFHNDNRTAVDAIMSVAPEYEEGDKEPIVEDTALLEIPTGILNIEQEALDKIIIKSNIQCSSFNTAALPKYATTYELESFNKHALVIFNQKEIDGYEPRYGTEKDVDSLTRTFENYGFEVTPHNDLTKDAIFGELKKFSERDFTDYGCVAVAILTHGFENGMLWAKDQLFSEIAVIKQFMHYTKPTLMTKPKIFIIQACRGSKISSGVLAQPSAKIRNDGASDLEGFYTLPLESDLLLIHSSYPGHFSYRDILCGTWFIQTLCKKIDTLSLTQDLESIITEVKREVAIDLVYKNVIKETGKTNIHKQMPVMTSTLIRKLYLKMSKERALKEKSRQRFESRHEVLDAVSSSPKTPLPDQFGPCSCFLEHFTYMRKCLRYFVAENPKDETAKGLLNVANTYDDSVGFDKPKDAMCKVISKYLMDKAQNDQFYKYLHFVPVERKVTTV